MSTYRRSPLSPEAPGRAEVLSRWSGQTMGGRIPAFMGLAQRTGGVYFENPPDTATALKQTGLDFEVRLERVQAHVAQTGIEVVDGEPREITTYTDVDVPRYRAAVGHYNDGRPPQVFSTWQSPRYRPIQTAEALELGEAMIREGFGSLAALGAYGDPLGSKVYAAYALDGMLVGGQDPYGLFLTLTTSHDGTASLTGGVKPIRLACTNETPIYFGRRAAGPQFKIRHTAGAELKADEAQRVLALTGAYATEYSAQAEALLAKKMPENDFIAWTRELFEVDGTPSGLAARREDELVSILNSDTNEFGRGRAYAAVQAVVEYADHFAPVRGTDPVAARQDRLVLGRMDDLKERAWISARDRA